MAAGKDWNRLAEYVRERRVELGMTQEDVRAAGGPSTATMRLIEGALQESYQPSTLRDLERALTWERGSVARILAGGTPEAPAERGATPAPIVTGVPVIDNAAAPEDVAPFLWQIRNEIDRARRQYGSDPTGEQIFGPGQEASTWDRGDFSEDVKIALLATFRLFAFKARSSESGDTRAGLRVLPGGA